MSEDTDLLAADPSAEDESDLESTRIEAVLQSSDWTTETILAQLAKGNIELSPAFQRREAWTDERKSTFIESLILRMPVPQLVLAERRDERGKFIVIDGKQRLIALLRFGAEADSVVRKLVLSGLKVRADLNGHSLASLKSAVGHRDDVSGFENETIRTVVLRNWRDESFLYRVFLRLNTGSLPLSPQELRQALNPGPFTTYADERSSVSLGLRRVLGNESADFRMRDVELFVRFFAFSLFLETYTGNLKGFLDDTCKKLNAGWEEARAGAEKTTEELEAAIEATYEIFEEGAFRRWVNGKPEQRFNRAIFDIMLFYFKDEQIRDHARRHSDKVVEAFRLLSDQSSAFQTSVQSTTKTVAATHIRLSAWGEALNAATGSEFRVPVLVGNRIKL